MPELPEVETIVNGLKEKSVGLKISRVQITGHRIFRNMSVDFKKYVDGLLISDIDRHGKFLLLSFSSKKGGPDKDHILIIHLGMTGQLLWTLNNEPRRPHTHFVFHLEKSPYQLRYVDIRRFGWMEISTKNNPRFSVPDAWKDADQLPSAIQQKGGMIKHALLNQSVLSGLGNIYVDESLHRAKIHPQNRIESLSKKNILFLCDAIHAVLKESIVLGGTSVRNYVDINGGRGGFRERLRVYGKEGTPCGCGKNIRKEVIAGRGTHYCPACQKIK